MRGALFHSEAHLRDEQCCDLLIDSDQAADLSNIDTTLSFSKQGQRERDAELLHECAVADRYSYEIIHCARRSLSMMGTRSCIDLHTYFDSPCRNTDELISLPGMDCARSAFVMC